MSDKLVLNLINFNLLSRLDNYHFILFYLNSNKSDLPWSFRILSRNNTGNSLTSMINQLKEDLGSNYLEDLNKLKNEFVELSNHINDIDAIINNSFEEISIRVTISKGDIIIHLSKIVNELFGKGLQRLGLFKNMIEKNISSLKFDDKTPKEAALLSSIFLTANQVFSDGNNRTGIYLFSLLTNYDFKFLINNYSITRPLFDLFLNGCGSYDSIISSSDNLKELLEVLNYDSNRKYIDCYNNVHIDMVKDVIQRLDKLYHIRKKYLKYKSKYLQLKN